MTVRLALNALAADGAISAQDKKEIVELTLFGQGVPTISPIPPSHPFYAKDVVVPKADPAAARKLLAEAGHPNGIKLPVILPVGRPVRVYLAVTVTYRLN